MGFITILLNKNITNRLSQALLRVYSVLLEFILSLLLNLPEKIVQSKIVSVLLNRFNVKIVKFISTEEYIEKYPSFVNLLKKRKIKYFFSEPYFYNEKVKKDHTLELYKEAQFTETVVKSAQIFGDSNLILVSDNLALFDLKFQDEEKKYEYTDGAIRAFKSNLCLLKKASSKTSIKKGIKLTANYSFNYYHFLYEVLSKFSYIKNLELSNDIPLLVDEVVVKTPQFQELINLFNSDNREVICIGKNERCSVNELYLVSDAMICPPNYLKIDNIRAEDFLIDVTSLDFIRETLLKIKVEKEFPKKILLSRKNTDSRRKCDETSILRFLEQHGFQRVFTEDYSIAEQVALFNQAEYIAGATGAAFSNLLFCNPKCKVLCFTNFKIPFSHFSSIASFVGIDMAYFYDKSLKLKSRENIHDSFNVDVELVKEYFRKNNHNID